MIIVIDNYDSFTYNLVQYLGEMGANIQVFRNDKISVEELHEMSPSHLLISPGPGDPSSSGVSIDAILQLGKTIPTLGVCLGHQAIGVAFDGTIENAPSLMHGKISKVHHNNSNLFHNIPNPFNATRYHSLVISEPLPTCIEVEARTDTGIVMGIKHTKYPIYGIQFHPESILTEGGKTLLKNFLDIKSQTTSR
ncbi:MAG TPA: anthranilate/aminodeoxychorismate synthase component II [Chloroflexi bacterium]|nr:anthranilate/aminodeoxychorismate synthase component II [Chloroflexota bacterium]|tara:strand:- start:130 stop:711 length:582 start_codon:yes stop_codon:yes gene_type:complete